MRKGLRITLGALAAFGMVHTASFALAPVFTNPLPDVIMHDKEDNIGRTMDMNFFRYINAFDIRSYIQDDDSPTSELRFVFLEDNSWNDLMIGNTSVGATQFRLNDPNLDIDDVSTWAQAGKRVEITQAWNTVADEEGVPPTPANARVWWWSFRNLLHSPEIAGGNIDQSVQPNHLRNQHGRFNLWPQPIGRVATPSFRADTRPHQAALKSQLGNSIFRFGPFPEPIGGVALNDDFTMNTTGQGAGLRVWGASTPGVWYSPGGGFAADAGSSYHFNEGFPIPPLTAEKGSLPGFTSSTRVRLITTQVTARSNGLPDFRGVGSGGPGSEGSILQATIHPGVVPGKGARRNVLLFMGDVDGNITTTTFGVYTETGGGTAVDIDRLSVAVTTLFKDELADSFNWAYFNDGTGPLSDATSGSGAGFISLAAGAQATSAAPNNKFYGGWSTIGGGTTGLVGIVPPIDANQIYRARFNVTPSGVPAATAGPSNKRNIPHLRLGPTSAIEMFALKNTYGTIESGEVEANPFWNDPGTATDLDVVWSGHIDAPGVATLAPGTSSNPSSDDARGFKLIFELLDINAAAGTEEDAGVMTLNQVCVEAHARPGATTPVTTFTDFRASAGWTDTTQGAVTVTENANGSIVFNDPGMPNTTPGVNAQFRLRTQDAAFNWNTQMKRLRVWVSVPTSVQRDTFHRFRLRINSFFSEAIAQEIYLIQQNNFNDASGFGNPFLPANADTMAGATVYEMYQPSLGGPGSLIPTITNGDTFALSVDQLHNIVPSGNNASVTATAVYQATVENVADLP